jgi:hypothetical protein
MAKIHLALYLCLPSVIPQSIFEFIAYSYYRNKGKKFIEIPFLRIKSETDKAL